MTSQDNFNSNSNPSFNNHVEIFKASALNSMKMVENIKTPDLQAIMDMADAGDIDAVNNMIEEQAEIMINNKKALTKLIASMGKTQEAVENSTKLPDGQQHAFAVYIGAQMGQASVQVSQLTLLLQNMDIVSKQIHGDDIDESEVQALEQAQIKSIAEAQIVQESIVKTTAKLMETVYGFTKGQQLDSITTDDNMTIKDFEKFYALITYSSNSDDTMPKIMPALQAGDIDAIETLKDVIDGNLSKIKAVAVDVDASSNISDIEKAACKGVTDSLTNIYQILSAAFEAMIDGDIENGVMKMMELAQDAGKSAKSLINYYDVLEVSYKNTQSNDNVLNNKNSKPKRKFGK